METNNMYKLLFSSEYKSIKSFETVELPNLVVLTGINGSGKTHFLQAIKDRNLLVEPNMSNIVYLDLRTFLLHMEPANRIHQAQLDNENAWDKFQKEFKPMVQQSKEHIGTPYYDMLKAKCSELNKSLWALNESEMDGVLYKLLVEYRNGISEFFKANGSDREVSKSIFFLVKKLPFSIDEIDKQTFAELYSHRALVDDFLPANLGRTFASYQHKLNDNTLKKATNLKGQPYESLSDVEFEKRHGRKPWEIMNEVLAEFTTMPYRVNSPFLQEEFTLRLVDPSNGTEINFDELSSGEKILMALVASVYKASSDNHFPDLLLLDEIDASLHPSMIINLFKVIEKVLLMQGIKVVLVTHSPSTVALAPEESVFIMNKSGHKRVEKKDKSEAIEALTEGFATLEKGLSIFDQVSRADVSIITEGDNAAFFEMARNFHNEKYTIGIITGFESSTGATQMKTLFEFFSKTQPNNKVIFVWDCDVKINKTITNLKAVGNVYPYIFSHNKDNKLASKGIENLFPENLLSPYIREIKNDSGTGISVFDATKKKDFLESILQRNTKEDFVLFNPLFDEIRKIKSSN
jgi:predicted ATP-binding protein involved in virulence